MKIRNIFLSTAMGLFTLGNGSVAHGAASLNPGANMAQIAPGLADIVTQLQALIESVSTDSDRSPVLTQVLQSSTPLHQALQGLSSQIDGFLNVVPRPDLADPVYLLDPALLKGADSLELPDLLDILRDGKTTILKAAQNFATMVDDQEIPETYISQILAINSEINTLLIDEVFTTITDGDSDIQEND